MAISEFYEIFQITIPVYNHLFPSFFIDKVNCFDKENFRHTQAQMLVSKVIISLRDLIEAHQRLSLVFSISVKNSLYALFLIFSDHEYMSLFFAVQGKTDHWLCYIPFIIKTYSQKIAYLINSRSFTIWRASPTIPFRSWDCCLFWDIFEYMMLLNL